MQSAFWGELAGTAVLILLGNGVVACVVLKKSYGHGSGWIVITAGWCFAVMAGVLTALAIGSHAHLNPAVTIGVAFESGNWSEVPAYLAGQLLGAMLGATLVWLHYLPHWSITDDAPGKRACFCTAPAIRHLPANFVSEVIGTFVLVLVAAAISSSHLAPAGLSPGIGPLVVGFLVWAIGLSLGGPTGYAINPARDLGPRIMHALLPLAGKGSSEWNYAFIPIAGPIIGALLAGLLVRSIAL
ncbi:MAG TPA: MIP/aquaporin family protein [Steroidobacteraceae bacterium]|nr:MIP/aquaporin family protein [Steroidobacteraceae bacterium]